MTLAATVVVALAVPFGATVLTVVTRARSGRAATASRTPSVWPSSRLRHWTRPGHQPRPPWLLAGWLVLLVAQVVSVVHVAQVEHRTSPLAHSSEWLSSPTLVIGLLSAAGFTLWGAAMIVAAGRAGPPVAPRRSDSLAP